MRLFMAAARWLSLVLVPFTAYALGLGDISLNSSLNQPFSAEIPLETADPAELAELKVALASSATFERYGLVRPDFLNDIEFAVARNERGQAVIRMSSSRPVPEPFVTMLLDLRWSSGRLLREYTVLLDPPLYEDAVVSAPVAPARSAEPVAQPPLGGAVERQSEAPVTYAEEDVIAPSGLFQSDSAEESAVRDVSPAAAPQAEVSSEPAGDFAPVASLPVSRAPAMVPGDSYAVQKGDTLWSIAERSRGGSGLSNNQMMLALYRANPEAFLGNINGLKAGSVLRIPPAAEISAPAVAAANAEVLEQHAAWSGEVSQPASTAAADGIDAEPAEEPAAPAEGRLQLVAPAETALEDAAEVGTADTEQLASEADGGAVDPDVSAEAEVSDDNRLVQIEDPELQALQDRVEAQDQAAGGADPDLVPAEDQIFADEDGAEVSEAVQPAPAAEADDVADSATTVVTTTDSGAEGGLLDNLWIWLAGAAAVLGALFLAWRRKSSKQDTNATGSWVTDIDDDPEATFREFADLESNTDSIVVEESDTFAGFDDPEATFDEAPAFAPAARSVSSDSLAPVVDDEATDIDFDPAPIERTASLESLGADSAQQAAGQDEVELPLEKTISTGAPLNLDQADPLAEADFHMAYGLYDQAADLLSRALANDPENRACRVKLIEVFFVWENKQGFLEQARLLHDSLGDSNDSDWNKVLILGKQLCPEESLFSGSAGRSPITEGMDLELSEGGETEIDFTLGDADVEALDLDMQIPGAAADSDDATVDFDFGSATSAGDNDDAFSLNLDDESDEQSYDAQSVDLGGLDEVELDFDLGSGDPESTMESPTIDTSLGFDDASEDSGSTMETPTLESPMHEATIESPTLDTLGTAGETAEMPSLDDSTSLDVDLSGLTDLPIDDDDILSVSADDAENEPTFIGDEKQLKPETENIRLGDEDETVLASMADIDKLSGQPGAGIGAGSPGDTVEQPQIDAGGDTAEQPSIAAETDFDFDLATVELAAQDGMPSDATMTEVGTKLDLARAYIDMGDPDGARSILKEVIEEGGDAHQQEARQLLEELSD